MKNQPIMSAFTVAMTLVCCLMATAHSAKILCLMQMCPKSHYNIYVPLAVALASRGHHVTIVSPYKTLNIPNVEEVEITNCKNSVGNVEKNIFEYLIGQNRLMLALFNKNVEMFCNAFVTDDSFKQLMQKNKHYDLVIMDGVLNECSLTIAPLVAKQVVMLNPTGQVPWATTSSPVPPSSVPMVVLPYPSSMTFFQRLWNTWTQLHNRLYFQYVTIPSVERIVQRHVPHALSVDEATQHVAMTLANTDPVLFPPSPQCPDLVLVGAMHCRPARPLPQEFTDFIEKTKGEGVIIFTLGSVVPSKELPVKIRDAFLAAFARLKQGVLWKFEDSLSDLPSNVMITSWLPQQDLLGNNQTRLFISHGGLLSSQEAVYHGVPVIAIPLFYDQIGNAARIKDLGIGESLDLNNLTADGIYDTIQRILNDQRYYDNMRSYSSILRDQPQKPTDRAVYWLEYVIRHEGADHLRSPALELSFIQYYLLDVIVFATFAIVTILTLVACSLLRFIQYWEKPATISSQKKISYPSIYSGTPSSK